MGNLANPYTPFYFRWWGIALLIAGAGLLLALGAYLGLVLRYRQQISTGELDLSAYAARQTKSPSGRSASGLAVISDYQKLAPDGTASLGPVDAAVTVVEFADFQCPYSAEAFPIVRELSSRYPQVRFAFRHYPLTDIHPQAEASAIASHCALAQGRFWEYHDRLFQNQANLANADWSQLAAQANLDVPVFQRCLAGAEAKVAVDQDRADALALGIPGTPTFYVNGYPIPGALPIDVWVRILDRLLGVGK